MLKSVPILCRFKILSVVLCVTLWYSNFYIYLKLTHIVTYGNILEYSKPLLAGHIKGSFIWSCLLFCSFRHKIGLKRAPTALDVLLLLLRM